MIYNRSLIESDITLSYIMDKSYEKDIYLKIYDNYLYLLENYLKFKIKHIQEKQEEEFCNKIRGNMPGYLTNYLSLKIEDNKIKLMFNWVCTNRLRDFKHYFELLDKFEKLFLRIVIEYVKVVDNRYMLEMRTHNEYLRSTQEITIEEKHKDIFKRVVNQNYRHMQHIPMWYKRRKYRKRV